MPASASAFFSALSAAGGSGIRTAPVNLGTGGGSRYLLVAIHNPGAPTDDIASVSVGGESLTPLLAARENTSREFALFGGYVTVEDAQTLSVSFSGDDFYSFRGSYIVIDDVNSTTPVGTPVSKINTGTGPNSDAAICPANGLIVSFMSHMFVTVAPTYTGSGTSHVAAKSGDFAYGLASRDTDGAHTWTTTTSSDWSVIMVPVNGASGGGGGSSLMAKIQQMGL